MCTTAAEGDIRICSLRGDLDSASAPTLHGILAVEGGMPVVVVDLAGVPFVDSAGIAVLAAAIRNLRAGGTDVVLVVPAVHMRRLFRTVGLDRVVPITEGLPAAVP